MRGAVVVVVMLLQAQGVRAVAVRVERVIREARGLLVLMGLQIQAVAVVAHQASQPLMVLVQAVLVLSSFATLTLMMLPHLQQAHQQSQLRVVIVFTNGLVLVQ
jgi:hypothetical protein